MTSIAILPGMNDISGRPGMAGILEMPVMYVTAEIRGMP